MIVASGDAKILDFGVARLDEGSLTNPGDLCGTPLYMSPEQASGHALDARSDIFSLGAVAWTLLTGQSPFDAPTVSAILMRVMHKSPPPPSEIVPGIPKDVDEILARALAKMPEDRYPDARQLAEDVEDALAGRVPRHRAEWNPIATGERTRVSVDGREEELPALPFPDGVPLAKDRGRKRRVWLSAALLLGLAASALVHFRAHPEDQRFWTTLARRAAVSPPAEALRAWVHPSSTTTPPTAGAATAWPDASPPAGPRCHARHPPRLADERSCGRRRARRIRADDRREPGRTIDFRDVRCARGDERPAARAGGGDPQHGRHVAEPCPRAGIARATRGPTDADAGAFCCIGRPRQCERPVCRHEPRGVAPPDPRKPRPISRSASSTG